MNNLYNVIDNLCKSRGIKPAKMCADIGISQGNISDLKYGRKDGLSSKNAIKIADYFGVTVQYLFGQEESPVPDNQDGADPLDQELNSLLPLLTQDQKKLLLSNMRFLLSDEKE